MQFQNLFSTSDYRLTLAYNSSCSMCVETAKSIQESSGGKIFVTPLNDKYIAEAFEYSGKEISLSKPLIILEEKGTFKIYDGYKLGIILARYLGIQKTWKVLKALGDEKNYANSGIHLSRKSFLRGAVGAITAATVLAGLKPAFAEGKRINLLSVDWFENLHIQGVY